MKRIQAICENFCQHWVLRCMTPDGIAADCSVCSKICRNTSGCQGYDCQAKTGVPLDCDYAAEQAVAQ